MMKGKLRKPLMRWAIRTGNSFCRYLALLWNHKHRKSHMWQESKSLWFWTFICLSVWLQELPRCGVRQEISQNTTGWPRSDAPRPEETSPRFNTLSVTLIITFKCSLAWLRPEKWKGVFIKLSSKSSLNSHCLINRHYLFHFDVQFCQLSQNLKFSKSCQTNIFKF